jgi:thiol-disulfide isomerase/thioredoxin
VFESSPGLIVLIVAAVVAIGFGTYRLFTDGRFAGTHQIKGTAEEDAVAAADHLLTGTPWESEQGERATLLQFSSAFCAPCRATRRILEDVAETVPGVSHIEIDAEEHLDVVRRLGVMRTPTTIIIGADGQELTRASGAPTKAQVLSALDSALE